MVLQHAFLPLLLVAMPRSFAGGYPATTKPLRAASPSQEMNFTVEGKINRLEQNKFTLNSEENILFHVRYDDKTEIKRQDGNSASAKDLRVGLKVKVDGDLTESGEIVAHRIVIESGEAPKKALRTGDARRDLTSALSVVPCRMKIE